MQATAVTRLTAFLPVTAFPLRYSFTEVHNDTCKVFYSLASQGNLNLLPRGSAQRTQLLTNALACLVSRVCFYSASSPCPSCTTPSISQSRFSVLHCRPLPNILHEHYGPGISTVINDPLHPVGRVNSGKELNNQLQNPSAKWLEVPLCPLLLGWFLSGS